MKRTESAEGPSEYLENLTGWRKQRVRELREAVLEAAAGLEEAVKWGHLVYSSNGPVLLIRAEEDRVLFGFWRGQRLQEILPALKPGGKYEMATVHLSEGDPIDLRTAARLVRAAVELNRKLGDPRSAAKR